jgi:membrane-associated phospholipid phosphatase
MNRALSHVRSLWPGYGWLLPLPFTAWGLSRFLVGETRWEYFAFIGVAPALAFASERTKRIFLAVFPIALLGLVYDMMRYVKDVGLSPERVHLRDLRQLESTFFGRPDWTMHDWLQKHPSDWLDRLCAIPYGTFIMVSLAFAIWLYVRADQKAVARFGWTFFAMNILGFVTYHVYPAAPPWYFHAHGYVVDLASHASEGPNLARVDAWMGVHYFGGMYARSNDVFGSVPSLHVAYPLLIVLEGWRWLGKAGKLAASAFLALMCFAAVYLDHHWIIDVVLGLLTCVVAYLAVTFVVERSRQSRGAPMLVEASQS